MLAAEIITSTADCSQLDPMVSAAIAELEQAGVSSRPRIALANSQYCGQAILHHERFESMRTAGTPLVAAILSRSLLLGRDSISAAALLRMSGCRRCGLRYEARRASDERAIVDVERDIEWSVTELPTDAEHC